MGKIRGRGKRGLDVAYGKGMTGGGRMVAGQTGRQVFVVFGMLAILAGLFWFLLRSDGDEREELRVACAAGLRRPMMKIAKDYEEEFGVRVVLQFGGSGALAGQLEVAGGDLFLPADEEYLKPLSEKGLVKESFAVAKLRAGLVVPAGNPKGLEALADMGKEGVRISLANRSAAIGRLTHEVLKAENLLEEVEGNVVVTKPTVSEVVEDVALGAVDVTVAWDAVVAGMAAVEWVALAEFAGREKVAVIAVLGSSDQVERAADFARFVADREKGGRVFEAMGFEPVGNSE